MAYSTILADTYYEALNAGLLIAAELDENIELSETPIFDFGGSCWAWDAAAPEAEEQPAWRLFLNRWAVDPAAVDYLAPVKVERLREQAMSLANAFPSTLAHLERLGCTHARQVLLKPIHSVEDVRLWAHSIWNAAVPQPPADVAPEQYPRSVASVTALLAQEAFTVIHPDDQGHVAVLPEENLQTSVYWASPGTVYANKIGERLGPRHPVSLKAYGRKTKEKHP